MSKFQSLISDYPTRGRIYTSASYCIFSFGIGPYLMSFFGLGFQLDANMKMWAQIGYHILNALVAIGIFRQYLQDSFLNVQLEPRKFAVTVAVGASLILAVAAAAWKIGYFIENPLVMQCAVPTVELELFALSDFIVEQSPIFGTLCMALLTPFAVSLLYYATGFAHACSSSSVRGYLLVSFILLIPRVINALTFWAPEEELILYLVHLPIHLIACRTYQKADTIWAPIATHMVANLIACIAWLLG